MEEGELCRHRLGKYRLVATLGKGGMGTVHLALARGLGDFRKLLVVKKLRDNLTKQKDFLIRFMDEAKLAARLDHPNVIQTFEADQADGVYYLAMEYLDGQTLSTLTSRFSSAHAESLPLRMHVQILCDVLTGLHYAHELRDFDGSSLHVVHRDVSPQNVFVTYHGQVKVVDFGVAKAANASAQTEPGMFVGKFAYAAPEQVLGHSVDARTDVFAVGVMLWQAITGQRFSEQVPTADSFRARVDGAEPRVAEMMPGVDAELARISDKALAIDPEQRFPTAQAFRSALQDYLQRTGPRVESFEIGQLVSGLFTEKRRNLHACIEAAIKQAGLDQPGVALPHADSKGTHLADLPSLMDVSFEPDEEKIREAHAHSKITLRPPLAAASPVALELVPEPEPEPPPMKRSRARSGALVALASALLIAVWTLVLRATPDAATPESAARADAIHVMPPAREQSTAPATALSSSAPPAPRPRSALTTPRSSPPSAASERRPRGRIKAVPPSRRRLHVARTPVSAPKRHPTHGLDLTPPSRIEPSSRPAVEFGTDLQKLHRSSLRNIDADNPY
jgi:serine/threonine-protein kinase